MLEDSRAPRSGYFFFGASKIPNIRDKVCWDPAAHAWKLTCKKPNESWIQFKDVDGCSLAVCATSAAEDYHALKLNAYKRALICWNKMDGSTRERIPIADGDL